MNRTRLLFFFLFAIISVSQADASLLPARQMEALDRGVLAVKTSEGIRVSWRALATDDPSIYFNVYKNGWQKLNLLPISKGPTSLLDKTNTILSDTYTVRSYVNGVCIDTSKATPIWENFYKTVPLQRPSGGTTPDAVEYTYQPNDASVGDLDGDGSYDIVLKWDPTNAKDNSQGGYTGNVYLDGYKIDGTFLWRIDLGKNIRAGAHYTQFMVYDLDGDGIAEITCKTAPGTIDGKGNYVILGSDDPTKDYRNSSGYILTGPEYLTVFSGLTGEALQTVPYLPLRGSVSSWGDSYGNRVDRFLACVAYLDGVRPSVVMGRGYYTRTTLAAYDFRDGVLTQRWFYDSGTTPGIGAYGQGNHNLSVADVDQDGKDEVLYGASAFDDDGRLLYRTGLGHGDAMHVSDLDPDVDGLEVWQVLEGGSAAYGYEMHNASTGQIRWGMFTGSDNGRGLAADISAKHRGFEMWSAADGNIFTCKGAKLRNDAGDLLSRPSINFRAYWDGDLQDELLDGAKLDKWSETGAARLVNFYNYANAKEVNGTKANPCLSADILGDWREEIIYRDGVNHDKLIIFTTTIPTSHRLYTLMHDPVYRLGVAWQNVAYNQPPHLGFYIGDGVDNVPNPNIYTTDGLTDLTKKPVESPVSVQAFARSDGSIGLRSSSGIQGIEIYAPTGQLLLQTSGNGEQDIQLSIPKQNRLLLMRIQTDMGIQSIKHLH